jgi:hypothetical protein
MMGVACCRKNRFLYDDFSVPHGFNNTITKKPVVAQASMAVYGLPWHFGGTSAAIETGPSKPAGGPGRQKDHRAPGPPLGWYGSIVGLSSLAVRDFVTTLPVRHSRHASLVHSQTTAANESRAPLRSPAAASSSSPSSSEGHDDVDRTSRFATLYKDDELGFPLKFLKIDRPGLTRHIFVRVPCEVS